MKTQSFSDKDTEVVTLGDLLNGRIQTQTCMFPVSIVLILCIS